jgi:hypothetical protein
MASSFVNFGAVDVGAGFFELNTPKILPKNPSDG